MDLIKYLPKDKSDYESIEKLKQLRKDDLKYLIKDLLVWMQDRTWPIFDGVLELLLNFDEELISPIIEIFNSKESDWKYNVLVHLLNQMPIDYLRKLEPDIIRLAINPTDLDKVCEVDGEAKELLKRINNYTS